MRFGVLGPVVAWRAGRTVPVGGSRERYVLATLLVNADRLTPAERLIDALWPQPPRSARAQLHNLVSRLRGRLDDGVIVTKPTGYELSTAAAEVDLLDFRALVERSRQATASSDLALAESSLSEALGLWRGPALADVPDELAGPLRAALHEERLATEEARLDARLTLGRHDQVLTDVVPLIAEHPYREGLYETRMLALVAMGRQVDALELYREVYRRFQEDLGMTPGPALVRLEQRILSGEVPVLGRRAATVVPRQLPPENFVLTGRGELPAEITEALRHRSGSAPAIAVLVGRGGVGKTALAVAAAHEVMDAFPDGQLFANLRGSHLDPVDPHGLIGRFLRSLGIEGSKVPADPDERIGLYRSTIADRRLLLVLDDAGTEAQVRPLVPGSPSCAILVTSRHYLGALLGATHWTVPALSPEGSLELLVRIAGARRIAAEPEAASAIVDLCGNLPLAICVAAGRLAAHPHWSVGEFRDRLAGERGRLDELSLGDLDVRASIATSYRLLDPPARLLLRRLGLLATSDWPAWVAAELLDEDAGEPVRRLLESLADVHLIEALGRDKVGQDRFRMHDLIVDFAEERAVAEDRPDDRDAALIRVLAGWSALAGVADERVGHGMQGAAGLDITAVPSDAAGPARDAPQEWFETELPALVTAVEQARNLGAAEVAGVLALRMSGFLAMRSYDAERERVLSAAAECARTHGADRYLVRLLLCLFGLAAQRSRFTELPGIAAEGLALARKIGDRLGEVGALGNAGWAAQSVGRLAEAARWFDEGVAACDEDTPIELVHWMSLSLARTRHEAGQPAEAVAVVERLLANRQPDDVPRNTAQLLTVSADALLGAGRPDDAERELAEAAQILGRLGDDLGSAHVQNAQARVHLHRGEWAEAEECLARVLPVQEELGVQAELASTLCTMGELELGRGRAAAATDPLRRALAIWREIGAQLEVARTLARLAHCDPGTTDRDQRECRGILRDLELTDEALRLPPHLKQPLTVDESVLRQALRSPNGAGTRAGRELGHAERTV